MAPRVGLIVPDDGPLDYELYRLAPWLDQVGLQIEVVVDSSPTPGVEVSANDARLDRCLRETGSDQALLPSARRLADQGCDTIIWSCTSGSFVGGLAWAERQAEHLRRVSGLPASSTTLAFIDAVRALRRSAVDVLTTYPAYVADRFLAVLAEARIDVVEVVRLETAPGQGFAKYADFVIDLDLGDPLVRFAQSGIATRPLLVPNTSMNTLSKVEGMERAAGRTIVTANQATLWQALRLLGRDDTLPAAGTLLRTVPT